MVRLLQVGGFDRVRVEENEVERNFTSVDERFLRHDVFAGRASRWFGHDELAGASFASRLCKNQIERNLGVVRIAVVHNR